MGEDWAQISASQWREETGAALLTASSESTRAPGAGLGASEEAEGWVPRLQVPGDIFVPSGGAGGIWRPAALLSWVNPLELLRG